MDIKVTTAGSVATISMNGRFDFSAHRSFKEAYDPLLQQKDITSLEINLADVVYMDSSALGMLLLLHERAQAEGKEVVLSRANSTVSQILDIANFENYSPFVEWVASMTNMSSTKAALNILLVDDSRTDLAVMAAMLAQMGHEVVQASSGETALNMFRQHMPDMVLMDVVMPGMGGYDAVREMRRIAQDDWIPIIFITALGYEDDIVCGIEAGGDDYLLKPINYKMLDAKINALHQHLLLFRRMEEQSQLLLDYQVRNEEERNAAQEFMGRLLALDKINDPLVQFHLQAAEVFSGDLIAVARTPAGHLYAMLADSTGHGLTAALAVMPVLQSFHAMVAKGYSIGALAAEINRKIREYLPANRFVAAVMIALNTENGRVSVWNGGCPPAILLDQNGAVVSQFDSMHLPLGVLDPDKFDDEVVHYHYGNRRCQILLCSDGAVDSADAGSMEIGMSHLLQAAHIENMAERLPSMVRMLEQQLAGKQAHDDIALILVNCPAEDSEQDSTIPVQPISKHIEIHALKDITVRERCEHVAKAEWQFDIVLTAPQLRQTDIVPMLLHVVNQIEHEGVQEVSGKLFPGVVGTVQ